jgi:hypothetical protein
MAGNKTALAPDPKLRFDFTRFRGDVRPLILTVLNEGVPADISGWTFELVVGYDEELPLAQVVWTVGPGATNGQTSAVVTPNVTSLAPGIYPYQLRYRTTTNPSQVVTFAHGQFSLVPSNNQLVPVVP